MYTISLEWDIDCLVTRLCQNGSSTKIAKCKKWDEVLFRKKGRQSSFLIIFVVHCFSCHGQKMHFKKPFNVLYDFNYYAFKYDTIRSFMEECILLPFCSNFIWLYEPETWTTCMYEYKTRTNWFYLNLIIKCSVSITNGRWGWSRR